MAEVTAGTAFKKKKKFLSPDSALRFGSKLDAADAHRIHSREKSPDAEEGGVEAESSSSTVCMRGEEK